MIFGENPQNLNDQSAYFLVIPSKSIKFAPEWLQTRTHSLTAMRKILILAIFFTIAPQYLIAQQEMKDMERRAREVISQLTLDEKISQLMNQTPGVERLGIEPYDWWNEALHGVGRDGRATVFPQPIGLGATFDPVLIQKIGDAIATEGRAKYQVARKNKNYARYTGLSFWSPNVNIFRDPRWGRGMETWGEDPYLTGTMGTAYVRGMQGDDPVYLKVAACGKHFAVHSGPEGTRHSANINPTKHDLWETYLPAFRMLVQDGHVETIMGAYNRVYGESCSGSKFLLTDILRKQWGFKGHIVSDCGAVTDIYQGHKIAKTEAEACAIAIKAGLNVECGNTFKAMKEAIDQGLLTEAELDKALLPLMMTRLKLGILEPDPNCPYNHIDEQVICCEENIALSKQAAVESMVLLKNNGILPLKKDIHTLFVTGAGAADAFWLMGNYFGISNRYCTYLQGIVSKVSNGTAVNYRPGVLESTATRNSINWAVDEAADAEVTIVVMGNNGNLEGEEGEAIDSDTRGDRVGLKLPDSQMKYLRDIHAKKGHGIVVVLTGGSPIDMREISDMADAVVMAWYPGQEGGYALGDLLFGDTNFSGRLPITFPEEASLLPDFEDYSMKGRTYKYMTGNIFYPFGYGLSYGKVTYREAKVTKKDKKYVVTVTLDNATDWDVTEVVQAYVSAPGAGTTAPIQQLGSFRRVSVPAKTSQEISFEIAPEQMMTVDEDGNSQLVKGEYTITISGAAPCRRSEELGVSSTSVKMKI